MPGPLVLSFSTPVLPPVPAPDDGHHVGEGVAQVDDEAALLRGVVQPVAVAGEVGGGAAEHGVKPAKSE